MQAKSSEGNTEHLSTVETLFPEGAILDSRDAS